MDPNERLMFTLLLSLELLHQIVVLLAQGFATSLLFIHIQLCFFVISLHLTHPVVEVPFLLYMLVLMVGPFNQQVLT